ncbi:MAG: hypothetical protein ACYS26_17180 [Planctomycetota bacterium]|jgi:hypothetical protein
MAQDTARIALAAGFASGILGAGLTLLLNHPAQEEASAEETPHSARPRAAALEEPGTAGVQEPDAELAMELAQLGERLAKLEARMADTQRVPAEGYVTRTELEELLAQLDTLEQSGGLAGLAPPDSEVFKQGVLDAVRTVEKERASEKYEAGRQARVARVDQDVAAMGKLLDLTPSQADNLRNAMLASIEREEQVLALWQAGASDEVLGATKQENHTLLQTDLGAFLTEEQLGMFNALAAGGGK